MVKKIKEIVTMMSSSEATLFTYAFAYSLIVGIAPFLIIAVVFMGTYFIEVDQIINFLSRYIPGDLITPFIDYISMSNIDNLALLVSLLAVSLWVGSKSIYSFVLLSSEYDQVETHHFVLRVLSLFYFILIMASVTVIGVLITYINVSVQLVIIPIMIVFFIAFYRLTSFRTRRLKDLLPGSLVASGLLLLYGQLFFVYVNQFSNYQSIYGPLASLMVLLISGWFIAWIVILGYTVNFVLDPHESRQDVSRFKQLFIKSDGQES